MSAVQKSEWPAGTGQSANQTKQREFTPDSQLVGVTVRKLSNAGYVVQQGQSGDFLLVSRNGPCRYCADLPALQAFAKLVGVKA